MRNRNRKGQIGETLTWMVATVLIIVVLIFFIFGASMLGKTKEVRAEFKETLTSKSIFEGGDSFLKKSLYTYNLAKKKGDKVIMDRNFKIWGEEDRFKLDFNETKSEIKLRLRV